MIRKQDSLFCDRYYTSIACLSFNDSYRLPLLMASEYTFFIFCVSCLDLSLFFPLFCFVCSHLLSRLVNEFSLPCSPGSWETNSYVITVVLLYWIMIVLDKKLGVW